MAAYLVIPWKRSLGVDASLTFGKPVINSSGLIAFQLARITFALALLAASGIRAYSYATSADTGYFLLAAISRDVVLTALQVIFASWLLSNQHQHRVRTASMVFLCLLIMISGYQLLSAKADCGCFGRFLVHPSVTLSLDLVLFGLFFFSAISCKNARL